MYTSIVHVNNNLKIFYAEDRGIAVLNSKSKGKKFYKEVIVDAVDLGVILSDVTATVTDSDVINLTYIEFNNPDYSLKHKVGTVNQSGDITWSATTVLFTSTTAITHARHVNINNDIVVAYQHESKFFVIQDTEVKTVLDNLSVKDNVRMIVDYDDNIYIFFKTDDVTINYIKWTVALQTWSQSFLVHTDVMTGDNRFDVSVTTTGILYLVYANADKIRLLRSTNGTTWVRVSTDNIAASLGVYYPSIHLDCNQNINMFISKINGDVTETYFIYSETGLLYSTPVAVKRFNGAEHTIEHALISSVVTAGDALNCSYFENNPEDDTLHVIYFKIVDGTYIQYSAINIVEEPIAPYFLPKTSKGNNLQPNIVEMADGTLYIYSYDKLYKRILARYSLDEGNTWTDDFIAIELTYLSSINHMKVIIDDNDTYIFFGSGGRVYMRYLGQFADEWSIDHLLTLDGILTESYVGGDKEKSWDVVLYKNGTISKFVLGMYRRDLDAVEDYINIADIALEDIDMASSVMTFTSTTEFQINQSVEPQVNRKVGVALSVSYDTAPTSNDWGVALVYTDSYLLESPTYVAPVVGLFRTRVKYKCITGASTVTTKTLYDHWVNNELPLSQYTISPTVCTSTFGGSEVHTVGYIIPRTKTEVIRNRTTSTELVIYGHTIPTDVYAIDSVPKEMIVGDSAVNLEQLYLSRCVVQSLNNVDPKNSVYIAAGTHTSIFGNTGVAYLTTTNLEVDTLPSPDKLYQNSSDKTITSMINTSYYIDASDSCIGSLVDTSDNLHICIAQAVGGKIGIVYSKWLPEQLPDANYHHNIFPTPIMVFDE